MKLYRIRRKSDGKFFTGWVMSRPNYRNTPPTPYPIEWGPSGAFFKLPATIKKHLKNLCSEFEYRQSASKIYWYHHLISTNEKLLGDYEVIVSDVSVNSECVIDSKSFMND